MPDKFNHAFPNPGTSQKKTPLKHRFVRVLFKLAGIRFFSRRSPVKGGK